MMDSYIFS